MKYQPFELIRRTGIDFFCGNVVKYVSRYKNKNGVEDLQKAMHYIQYMREKNVWQHPVVDWEIDLKMYCTANNIGKLEYSIMESTIRCNYHNALSYIAELIKNEGGANE